MKESKLFYWTPRVIIVIFSALAFIFSLFSGAEKYGGGFYGILKNSPNALPWLLLFGVVYFAWNHEKIGGYLFLALGIASIFFFNSWENLATFFIVSLPIIVAGILFLLNHYKHNK